MIYKNIKLGNVENVTFAEFGNGTISIVNASKEIDGVLSCSILMKTKEPAPIGEIGEFVDSSDAFKPELVISFKNKESFDVFCKFIENIKKDFQN